MSLYARVNADNFVTGLKESDTAPSPSWLLVLDGEAVDTGWTYVPNENPRFKPNPYFNTWTAYQFLLRFTEAELTGIRAASVSDPITWRFLTLATAAQEIRAADPTTTAGMDYLVSQNLITAQRKMEILS
jgi:hypothetical protein